MAITDKKISTVYSGQDISSMSTRPNDDGLTAAQVKARFDQLPKDVIHQYNALIDELNDTVLPGKSDVGHTHDDRYYTETEVDTLLLNKSDTTHNHALADLTGDLMVSGRQLNVGTLTSHLLAFKTNNVTGGYFGTGGDLSLNQNLYMLPSKAVSNANSVNNSKLELLDTGAVITRNVNDANIALKVNQQQGTGDIIDFQFGGVSKASVTKFGQLKAPILLASGGLAYTSSTDNAYFQTPVTGPVISRNVADANPALKVNQANASSTGNIAEFQFGGTSKVNITKYGEVQSNYFSNPSGVSKSQITLGDGTLIDRNVADATPALKVNQANASSTGKILDLQFGGTSKAYIDNNGNIIGNIFYGVSIVNKSTGSNANLTLSDGGVQISRNIADANHALTVNLANASSTGVIQSWQFVGVGKAFMSANGQLGLNQGIRNYVTGNNSAIDTATTGVSITRNIADANPVLIVNNRNTSSTGNIAEFQFNGTTKLAIDKNGLIAQEAWITPTFTNGASGTVQYRINKFGRLEFKGDLVGVAGGASNFTLPTGYRPSFTTTVALAASDGTIGWVKVYDTGEVTNASALATKTISFNALTINTQ